jgi:hypothetical protein
MIIGIVGKPNVGKSAFFRALTLAGAESANFPFTTIDANSAIGYVKVKDPATQFGKHSNPREGYIIKDYRFVPIEIIDVAGLVPGAHEGKGLGNKFLDDLRQADALIHVIDLSGSTNDKGEPIELNSYDPSKDITFLEEELDHWYHNIIKRNWENIEKRYKLQGMKIEEALSNVLSGLKISEEQINIAIKELNLKKNISENLFSLAKKLRELTKPIIIAANKTDILLKDNLWQQKLDKLKQQFPNYNIIPVMAEYEWNLKQAAKSNIISYLPGDNNFEILKKEELNENQKKGLSKIKESLQITKTTGVQDALNSAVFDLLEMKPIFPGGATKLEDSKGNVLPDCFLMQKDATALDFAYRLHTDFGKKFIKAIDVKTKMMVGKDHILKFGDIIEIVAGK